MAKVGGAIYPTGFKPATLGFRNRWLLLPYKPIGQEGPLLLSIVYPEHCLRRIILPAVVLLKLGRSERLLSTVVGHDDAN